MQRSRLTFFAGAAGAAALALILTFAAGGAAPDAGEPAAAPAAAAQDEHAGHAAPAAPAEAEQAALTVVPNDQVCMVNDRFFGRKQIPVEVEGDTYYGCCEGCKKRLAEDRTVRFAVDPVTGEEVDKATAVIGARPDDTVLYFASRENLEKHLAGGA